MVISGFGTGVEIMKAALLRVLFLLFASVSLEPARETVFESYYEFSTMPSRLIQGSTTGAEECRQQEKCYKCIQTAGCMWCKDKNLPMESRCFLNSSRPVNCTDANVENPRGTLMQEDSTAGENLKIHPQVVQLSLRKGEKRNITMSYTDEKNRPLDLYVLMDLSCSMHTHKERVANLSLALAENLQKLTSDLRIGFGTFVDKNLAPFGLLNQNLDKENGTTCNGKQLNSLTLPYSFKNNLKLTNEISQFKDKVMSAGISFNYDVPEGTLDAMLQSIVCTSNIGWRVGKEYRKLLVISTDGSYHLAGDGKLVGVVLPHDGMCYMDSEGLYTGAARFDYPSISLIRQKIKENEVFVIFAVTEEQKHNYRELSQALKPFAVTQPIDNNNNSITSVIENEYRKLVNTVTILSEYKEKDHIDIKFYAKCPGDSDFKESSQCEEVGPGVTVSFKIEVELKECPSNENLWMSNVTIYPQSSRTDFMSIHLSMLCGCDCEKKSSVADSPLNPNHNSSDCSNNGHLRCGICECQPGWGGAFCNCTAGERDTLINGDQCVDPTSGLICNSKGHCDGCGQCKCESPFGGTYCQCSNADCPFDPSDKGLCNNNNTDGSHGECICGKCVCLDGYSGSRCECPTGDEMCRDDAKSPNHPCNGITYGSCKCGKCMCSSSSYKGEYCEIQHAKIDGSCRESKVETDKCIRCLVTAYNDEEKSDEAKIILCKRECDNVNVTFTQRIDRIPVEDKDEKNICFGTEEDARGCRIDYIIREKHVLSNIIMLEIESGNIVLREKCPTPAPLFEIMIGIIGAMVLLGVTLLLLWKTITHVQDRMEYERFEKSVNAASWNTQENPLYRSTTTTVTNPTYVNYEENGDSRSTEAS